MIGRNEATSESEASRMKNEKAGIPKKTKTPQPPAFLYSVISFAG
jgi:hypothetical protein